MNAQGGTATATRDPGLVRRWPSLLLTKLGRLTLHRITAALEPLGLKPREFAALVALGEHGPVTQQGLAEELHLDPTNVVALLNQLESRGLATRSRDPEDRRRHIVEISKRGRTQLAKGETAMNAAEDGLLDALDEGDREELAELLNRIWLNTGGMSEYLKAAAELPPEADQKTLSG